MGFVWCVCKHGNHLGSVEVKKAGLLLCSSTGRLAVLSAQERENSAAQLLLLEGRVLFLMCFWNLEF